MSKKSLKKRIHDIKKRKEARTQESEKEQLPEFYRDALKKIQAEFKQCVTVAPDSLRQAGVEGVNGEITGIYEYLPVVMINSFTSIVQCAIIKEYVGIEGIKFNELTEHNWDEVRSTIGFKVSTHSIFENEFELKDAIYNRTLYIYTREILGDQELLLAHLKTKGYRVFIKSDDYYKETEEARQPDVFICHDSQDKVEFVEPLVNELKTLNLKVWYDNESMSLGDSLQDSIEDGLSKSKFGVVIVSHNFINNTKWTRRELRTFLSRELQVGKKVILPIRLNVTPEEVSNYHSELGDKISADAEIGVQAIASLIYQEVTKGN